MNYSSMNRNRYISCFFLLASILLISEACTKKSAEPLVCFQEEIQPIMVSRCSSPGCHNPIDRKNGYDFTTYEGLMKGIKKGKPRRSIVYTVIKNGEMPPAGHPGLNEEELFKLEQWIKLGALNSSECGNGNCDTSVYTYSGSVKALLQSHCTGCHNANNLYAPYDFNDFQELQSVALSGELAGSIKHEVGYIPMPSNGPRLSDCQIEVIEKWIAAGALNN